MTVVRITRDGHEPIEVHRETLERAFDDAAYYRLGEAANAEELEDDDDRELYLLYCELYNMMIKEPR